MRCPNGMLLIRTVYDGFSDEGRIKNIRLDDPLNQGGAYFDNPFAQKVYDHVLQKAHDYEIEDEIDDGLGEIRVSFFNDKCSLTEAKKNIRRTNVYLIHQFLGYEGEQDSNIGFMALFKALSTLKYSSAAEVNVILPYIPDLRQDRKHKGRVPINAKLMADLMYAAGASRVLTVDLHANQIQGFYNIPLDNLKARPVYLKQLQNKENTVFVSPDTGGADTVRELAKKYGVRVVVLDKRREKAGEAKVMNVIGDVDGMDAVMLDDIIDTAKTLGRGAIALKEKGAKSVHVYGTHGIFSKYLDEDTGRFEIAENNLMIPAIDGATVSNTIVRPPEYFQKWPKIKLMDISELIADATCRIQKGDSVSELFE